MDLRTYLGAIRKSWWIVLLALLLGGLAGYGQSKRSTKIYAGHVTFYVATPGLSGTSPQGSDQFAQDRANTYAQLLSSQRLASMIISAQGLKLSPSALAGEISGAAELNTVLVKATIKDSSLARLRVITTAVAKTFPKMVDQLDNSGATSSAVRLSVVSGPAVSSAPVSPRTSLNVAIGIAIGLLLGLLLAVLREVLDVSIRSPEALQEFGDAPVVGVINLDSAAKRSPLVVGAQVHSVRAEAFRQLRTNLSFIDAADPVGVLAVTSSVAGEGKSITASNLALVFAETGVKVLLVDADLRRSTIADYLSVERQVGLTDVLVGHAQLDDALHAWGSQGLVVLPSGSTPPNPSGLLGSPAMLDLVAEMRRRFDIVIFDTPPIVPVTDATVIATYVDGVLLVFRHGKTRRTYVATSLRLLRGVNARVLGFVMNMKPLKGREASGYRRYGYHAEEPARGAKRLWAKRRRVPAAKPYAGVARSAESAERAEPADSDESAESVAPPRAGRTAVVPGRADRANLGSDGQRGSPTGNGDVRAVTDSLRDE